jgi:hypothetical protein
MVILWLIISILSYSIWILFCLECNVRKARGLKLPVVRIPIHVNSILWVIVQPLLWKSLALLPIAWSSYPDFVRFSHRNWHFLEKSDPTQRFGPIWALVSPGGIHLHFSDPDAIQDIFSRWRDFVRPVEKYRMFNAINFGVGLTLGRNPGYIWTFCFDGWIGRLASPSQSRGSAF